MELCEGSLDEEIRIKNGKFPEKEAAEIIFPVLKVVAYCHEKNIAHCDLESSNIFIDRGNNNCFKIAGFDRAAAVFDCQKLTK